MGGADPQKPELRAASIRGAMRFWFRAMAGAVTDDPREVYKLESEVFGNTEKKSKVVVRVIRQFQIKEFSKCFERKLVNYIGYGLYGMSGHPDKKSLINEAKFEIKYPYPEFKFPIAYSLWFIQNIGGFGARSRKGFGSVSIVSDDTETNAILKLPVAKVLNKTNIASHIRKALNLKEDNLDFVQQSEIPSLSPHLFNFVIINTHFFNEKLLLYEINKTYRTLRRTKLTKQERKYLGFSKNGRRSSPLFIRPVKPQGQDTFSLVLFLFKTKFHRDYPDPNFSQLWKEIIKTFENLGKRYPYA